MFVSVYKKGGVEYVRVAECYRENGKVKKRVIKSYGRLENQLRQNPNFLEELKSRCSEESGSRLLVASALRMQAAAEDLAQARTDVPGKRLQTFQFGHYPLLKLWHGVLGLDSAISYLQKTRTSVAYSLCRAAAYLTFTKVLEPRSVLYSYAARDNFLGDPLKSVKLDNLYDCYERLESFKESIVRRIGKRIGKIYGKESATLLFYDVTGVSCETTSDELATGVSDGDIEPLSSYAEQCRHRQSNPLGDEFFDPETGNVLLDKLPRWFLDEVEGRKIEIPRTSGPSNECRSEPPVASVALVIDSNGFPLDFEIYAGNASALKAMPASIERLRKTYDIEDAVVIADRESSFADTLSALLEGNLGFFAVQDLARLDAALIDKMLDLKNYSSVSAGSPAAGVYFTVPHWQKTDAAGKSVDCTLVLTWNEDRKEREDAVIDVAVSQVEKRIGEKIGSRKAGWSEFARVEKASGKTILGVDGEAVKRKRRFSGFAALAYSQPRNASEQSSTDADIAGACLRLNRIESCFQTFKNNLGLRPMYVWSSSRIKGHVTVCFLALVLLRLMQERLDAIGKHLSAEEICRALREASVLAWKSKDDVTFASPESHANGRRVREETDTAKIRTMPEAEEIEDGDNISDILRACGLKPIPAIASRSELATCLGTRWPTMEDAIPELRRIRM